MEELKQLFVDMQFSAVKTHIQSGNVIFQTQNTDKLKLTKTIEYQLLKTFSVEIRMVIFAANELIETIGNAPKGFESEPQKFRYDVWFLLPKITTGEFMSNVRLREGVDFLQVGKNVIYTARLTNEINKSYLQKKIF